MPFDSNTVQDLPVDHVIDVIKAQLGVFDTAAGPGSSVDNWINYFRIERNDANQLLLSLQKVIMQIGSRNNHSVLQEVEKGVEDESVLAVIDNKSQIKPWIHEAFRSVKGMAQNMNTINNELLLKQYNDLLTDFEGTLQRINGVFEKGDLTEEDVATPRKKRCLTDLRKSVRKSLDNVHNAYFPDDSAENNDDAEA
jgi:hypothetical protein